MADREKQDWLVRVFFWIQLLAILSALGMAAGIAWLAGWIF